MAKIVGVASCPTGIAHSLMAAEALKKTAPIMGHDIRIEIHGAEGTRDALTEADIASADVVILAADIHVGLERFGDKPIHETSTSRAIRETQSVIDEALRRLPEEKRAVQTGEAVPIPEKTEAAQQAVEGVTGKRIVAITACPTGIAHTFMAADALKKAAAQGGHEIRVETQGSVGAKAQLTEEE
ncbi:MAG: PTS fructose-like transporter subunit IIB, partial [Rhodoplanes sp.]